MMIDAVGSKVRVLIGAFAAAGVLLAAAPGEAQARVRRVPERYATIQAAVDAADAGDVIDVAPGSHCGATIDRPVNLQGHGRATIVGCASGPALSNGVRAGFRLPGADGVSAASGTQIEGFIFDGRGVSAANLEPLGVAIIATFANDVRVERNHVLGTVQGITNTGGDRWVIVHNVIDDLGLFDCTGALCAGGDGIVIQVSTAAPDSRPQRNLVAANVVNGAIPDGFGVFSMVGVFVFAADGTIVTNNRLSIPDNPNADAIGQGVLVDNSCCGQPAVTPGARGTVVTFNDGRASEIAVEIGGTGGENTGGLVLFGNLGPVVVEGALVDDGPRPRRGFVHGRRLGHHHPTIAD
jgi:nitrous oxidase accessory protein NosD